MKYFKRKKLNNNIFKMSTKHFIIVISVLLFLACVMDGHAKLLEDRYYQNISSNATVSHDQAMKRGDRFHPRAGKKSCTATSQTDDTILHQTKFMSDAGNDAFKDGIGRIKNGCKFMCQRY